MASPSVDLGSGWTLTMSGFVMQALSARWVGVERATVETTHLGTAAAGAGKFGNKTFTPGTMVDPGRIEGTFHFNPDDEPPIEDAATTCTATWPSTGTASVKAKWAASGFMQSFDVDGVGIDEKMLCNVVIKLTGNVTVTAAT
jgi:hypothetical protein